MQSTLALVLELPMQRKESFMKYPLVLVALLVPVLLHAEPLQVSIDCPEWVAARKQDNYQNSLAWIQGFVAAYNQYEYAGSDANGVLGTHDDNAVAKWMDNYCQENTSSNPREAIESLIDQRKHVKNACPTRRQSGRPCPQEKEAEKPAINE